MRESGDSKGILKRCRKAAFPPLRVGTSADSKIAPAKDLLEIHSLPCPKSNVAKLWVNAPSTPSSPEPVSGQRQLSGEAQRVLGPVL